MGKTKSRPGIFYLLICDISFLLVVSSFWILIAASDEVVYSNVLVTWAILTVTTLKVGAEGRDPGNEVGDDYKTRLTSPTRNCACNFRFDEALRRLKSSQFYMLHHTSLREWKYSPRARNFLEHSSCLRNQKLFQNQNKEKSVLVRQVQFC